MPADIIRAQYQELDAIAKRFQQQAEAQTQLRTRLTRAVRALQQGGWVGKGASAFFAEMDNVIFPALQRSVDACGQGNQVTRMIIEILQAAEREASSPFRTGATVGATATDASAVGSTGSGPMTSGSFTLGPPHRPESIYHDNGFLDRFHPESPTLQDYTQLGKWRILLAGSKLATKAGVKDLDDANDAYEHFLDGKGADRTFNLDEYIAEDPSGRQNLQTAVQDARQAAGNTRT